MANRAWYWHVIELVYQFAFYTCPLWMHWGEYAKQLLPYCRDYLSFFRVYTTLGLVVSWLLGGAFYGGLYYFQIPFFEKYRIQEWVWNREESPRKAGYLRILKETVIDRFLIGQFFSSPVSLYFAFGIISEDITDIHGYIDSYDPIEGFWKLMVSLFIFETFFYWMHRALHLPQFYHYHKDHHAYYVPVSWSGLWGSAIDGLVSLPLPGILPVFLFNFHIFTFVQWCIIHTLHTQYDHGGYDFPFNWTQLVPFGSHTDAHNFHHSHNVDNFGLYWRFWDVLLGTDKQWKQYQADKQQLLKDVSENKIGTSTSSNVYMKDGVALVHTVAEERDVKEGDDLLKFTLNSHFANHSGERIALLSNAKQTKKTE